MLARLLLPDADLFELDDVTIGDEMIILSIRATQPTATCSVCPSFLLRQPALSTQDLRPTVCGRDCSLYN
jgi:hypothetical protein